MPEWPNGMDSRSIGLAPTQVRTLLPASGGIMKEPRKGTVKKAAAAKKVAAKKPLDRKLIQQTIDMNVRWVESEFGVKINADELYRASKLSEEHGRVTVPFKDMPIHEIEQAGKMKELKHRLDLILSLKKALELEAKK
jgi:hypothetical protein